MQRSQHKGERSSSWVTNYLITVLIIVFIIVFIIVLIIVLITVSKLRHHLITDVGADMRW